MQRRTITGRERTSLQRRVGGMAPARFRKDLKDLTEAQFIELLEGENASEHMIEAEVIDFRFFKQAHEANQQRLIEDRRKRKALQQDDPELADFMAAENRRLERRRQESENGEEETGG